MHTCNADPHAHGLQDGCARCAEHAEHPFRDLDDTMLRDLIDRTLRDRFGRVPHPDASPAGLLEHAPFGLHEHARSETEARAMAVVMTEMERFGKAAETAPDLVALYLKERWRLDVSIENPMAEAIEAMRRRLGG